MNFNISIDTTRELNWTEMKDIYVETREFLVSDSVQNDFRKFYQKKNKREGTFGTINIRFDFLEDGRSNIWIMGINDGARLKSDAWEYWDYGDGEFKVTKDGELIKSD